MQYIKHTSAKLLKIILLTTQIALLPMVAFTHTFAAGNYDRAQIILSASDIAQSNSNYTTIWDAIRPHLSLNDYDDHPAVKQAILWYTSHPKDLNKMFQRAAPYLGYIHKITQQKNLPAELALLPMVESSFIIHSHSSAGANGLWQLRPGTARDMGLEINYWYDGRNDIAESTNAALDYLTHLHNYFNDWLLALAAYNDGPGLIHKRMQYNLNNNIGASYWQLNLPHETRAYLPRLLAFAAIMRNPSKYNIKLPNIAAAPLETEIIVHGQVNLITLARESGLQQNAIYNLNPAWKYTLTNPDAKNYKLLVPTNKLSTIKHLITNMHNRLWLLQQFNKTVTLTTIAKKYKTSVRAIKNANKFKYKQYAKANELILLPQNRIAHAEILPTAERSNSTETNNVIRYAITKDDTFDSIARKFGVSVNNIIKWNHIHLPATLHVLQVLTIKTSQNKYNDNNIQNIITKINS